MCFMKIQTGEIYIFDIWRSIIFPKKDIYLLKFNLLFCFFFESQLF